MNEFRAICGGIRGMLADNFGEEKGNKVFDILSSNKSEDESVKEVKDVLYGDAIGKIDENKFSKGDLEKIMLKAIFGESGED